MSTNQNKVFKDTIAEQNKSNRQLGFIDRVFGRGRIKRKVGRVIYGFTFLFVCLFVNMRQHE